jgi:glycosyltransferase involved in cell wall biosynthesis
VKSLPLNSSFVTLLERGMKGWVMDGIAHEAPSALGLKNRTFYLPTRYYHRLLFTPNYLKFLGGEGVTTLFLHHRGLLRYHKLFDLFRVRVFVTHLDETERLSVDDWAILSKVKKVIFQNSTLLDWGIYNGLARESCSVAHGAVSEKIYRPSSILTRSAYVLISGENKPRKNPELIREVINSCKDLHFIIHGKGWSQFFGNKVPHNLKLIDFEMKRQPKLMREAHTLLSLSRNEGGPFPVLEALASGTPVVATNTGFCKEIIDDGNGVLLNSSSTPYEIGLAIKHSMTLKQRLYWKSILPSGHTWEDFAERLYIQ